MYDTSITIETYNAFQTLSLLRYLCIFDTAGSGVIGIGMARRYPTLKVTLFEVEPVINIVKEHFLPKAGDCGNVSLLTGAYEVDGFGYPLLAEAHLYIFLLC
jgi:hypothetical protein